MTTLTHSWALAGRHTRALVRQPWFVGVSLAQPLIWLLLFGQLFEPVTALPGFPSDSYLAYLTPGVVLMTAMFANSWNGMAIIDDMHQGVLDRMLTTGVRRSALLNGITIREALSLVLQTAVLVALAAALGARFAGGTVGFVVLVGVAMLLGAAFGGLSMGVALTVRQREAVIGTNQFLVLPGLFLSTAFMPPDLLPGWIATVASFNPVDWAAVAAREATLVAQPDWGVIGGRAALLAAFALFATVGATRAFRTYQASR